jgi:hypothetical protein
MARKGSGGCACGQIRYEFEGNPRQIIACHCTYCQARSGSAFGMGLFLDADAVRITQGEVKIYRRTADSGRPSETGFCPECGTQIYGRPQWRPDTIVLRPGTLDDRSWIEPDVHIWTRSKQTWVMIPEDVPSFEEQSRS